jgi:hypothetical protein
MIGLDTNVLLRYLVQDDPVQSSRATELLIPLGQFETSFRQLRNTLLAPGVHNLIFGGWRSMRTALVFLISLLALCLGTAQNSAKYTGHSLEPFPGPQVYKDPTAERYSM